MPICPQCSLGLPPTLTKCPDCGRLVVEVVTTSDTEGPQSDSIALAVADDPIDEPGPVLEAATPAEPEEPDERELSEELESVLPSQLREEAAAGEEEQEEERFDTEDAVTIVAEPVVDTTAPLALVEVVEDEDDLEQFLAGAKRFTRIVEEPAQAAPQRSPDVYRQKPVRWAHRAYRGDIDVIDADSSRGVTLAIFGDGLLVIESGSRASAAISNLLPALAGRRSTRKAYGSARSSAQAAERVAGARHLATLDIHSVRVEKGRTRARQLTVRTMEGEELSYRFSSKRYRQVVALLSPVLGPKLRDATKAENTSKRAV